jgi:hypothetical protein
MIHPGQPVDGACHAFQPRRASLADGIDERLQIDRLSARRQRRNTYLMPPTLSRVADVAEDPAPARSST